MAKSLSRKSTKTAINKCKSRTAKLLHKKAKTPVQRRKVLSKAAKRCTKKKVLARRARKPKAPVSPKSIPQPIPIDVEEEDQGIYPPEFIIRHLYPQSYEKSGFDTMKKEPVMFESLNRTAALMVERYSDCRECMITLMTIENQETGQKTSYDFLSSPPPKPEEGRYFVDIYLEDIPMQMMNRFEEMKEEVREADCDEVAEVSEENQQEVLKNIRSQRFPNKKLLIPLYEDIQNAEEARKAECEALIPGLANE